MLTCRTGWALTLLSDENLSYASTCQTIGLNTGYFASFTVFLALNSEAFRYALVMISLCKAFGFINPLACIQPEMGHTTAIS
jgi:Acetyl-coenzyme A transporter 1